MHSLARCAIVITMVYLSQINKVHAGDANPPIDNGSVTVDLSSAVVLPSDKSGYSEMIQADSSHKIYLKCFDITGDKSTSTQIPCLIQSNGLSVFRAEWAPYHTSETFLFFDPKATSFNGTISGSIGASTVDSWNKMEVLADNKPIYTQATPGSSFDVAFSGSGNVLKIGADFLQTVGATPGDANAYYRMNMGSITWSSKPQYKLKVRTLASGDGSQDQCAECIADPSATKIKDGDSITLPLGARALITLKDASDGSNISAIFTLNGAPAFNPAISSGDQAKGLYMDRLGVMLGSGATLKQDSIWVHMGVQALTITPTDSTKPPITIAVNVIAPDTLGTSSITDPKTNKSISNNQSFDALIVKYAHLRGIPPQFLKGEATQESSLSASNFRYEPVTRDLGSISNGKNKYQITYQKYLFGLANNPVLTSQIISPRGKYGVLYRNNVVSIPDNYETTAVAGRYTPLLCSSIMAINNHGAVSGTKKFIAYNWDESIDASLSGYQPVAELEYGNLLYNYKVSQVSQAYSRKYNFTAQTVVASSYGLMQILYTTAASKNDGEYLDSTGAGLDPSGLLDPEINLKVGSLVLKKKYTSANGNVTTFSDFSSFIQIWRKGFQKYNGAKLAKNADNNNLSVYNYGVWSYSKLYFPRTAVSIFN